MSVADSLKAIQADLLRAVSEDVADIEQIELSARRIGAQAEMLERGLDA